MWLLIIIAVLAVIIWVPKLMEAFPDETLIVVMCGWPLIIIIICAISNYKNTGHIFPTQDEPSNTKTAEQIESERISIIENGREQISSYDPFAASTQVSPDPTLDNK